METPTRMAARFEEAVARRAETPEIPPDVAWSAVLARDARYDGRFLYGVRSTGIYCRPTCPSRRPHRRHVLFFLEAEAAEQAGFRACRRCRPREAQGPERRVAEKARAILDLRADEPVTLAQLAAQVGLSRDHLQRVFKAAFGLSPKEYHRAARAERFKVEVRRGPSVTAALYEAGFSSGSRLYEQAARTLGMTPAAYRRGGRGERIRFTITPSPIGRLLVAATDRGICAVQLGDDDGRLEAGLRQEYPEASLERDPSGLLEGWVRAVLAAIEAPTVAERVPLDLAGTPFQRRVWTALQQIPPGETRTYAEVARAVGRPRAVRAVAAACARNDVALLIPCHRVIRSDGELGGYRWGVARKRRLLARERRRR